MEQEPTEDRRNILILVMGGLGILVIIALIVYLILITTRAGNSGTSDAPYDLSFRPIPAVTNVRDLFPAAFGKFTRKKASGDLSGVTAARFGASYVRGNDTITISGSRDSNTAQAEADLNSQAQQLKLDRPVVISPSLSFVFYTPSDGSVRILYTRSYWFFDISGSSRAALDDFMKVFPY